MSEFWGEKMVLVSRHTGFKGSRLLIWHLQEKAKNCGFSLRENKSSAFNCCIDNLSEFLKN